MERLPLRTQREQTEDSQDERSNNAGQGRKRIKILKQRKIIGGRERMVLKTDKKKISGLKQTPKKQKIKKKTLETIKEEKKVLEHQGIINMHKQSTEAEDKRKVLHLKQQVDTGQKENEKLKKKIRLMKAENEEKTEKEELEKEELRVIETCTDMDKELHEKLEGFLKEKKAILANMNDIINTLAEKDECKKNLQEIKKKQPKLQKGQKNKLTKKQMKELKKKQKKLMKEMQTMEEHRYEELKKKCNEDDEKYAEYRERLRIIDVEVKAMQKKRENNISIWENKLKTCKGMQNEKTRRRKT
jgi:hypothetical protein